MIDKLRTYVPGIMMLTALALIWFREWGYIAWPLWLVTMPLWIGIAIVAVALAGMVLIFVLGLLAQKFPREED